MCSNYEAALRTVQVQSQHIAARTRQVAVSLQQAAFEEGFERALGLQAKRWMSTASSSALDRLAPLTAESAIGASMGNGV